jgi:sirohydrochlorin ferrochelatase
MKALILIAHGSRRDASNQEVAKLTADIAYKLKETEGTFDCIRVAFLELASPSIPDAVDSVFQQGATSATLFPYFLSAGKHVEHDIPEIVADLEKKYPRHSIVTLPYLGTIPSLQETIVSHVTQKSHS